MKQHEIGWIRYRTETTGGRKGEWVYTTVALWDNEVDIKSEIDLLVEGFTEIDRLSDPGMRSAEWEFVNEDDVPIASIVNLIEEHQDEIAARSASICVLIGFLKRKVA